MARRRRILLILVLVPLALYAGLCAVMYFAQTDLLFPVNRVGASGPLPPRAERWVMTAGSGDQLVGLHVPPARPSGERLLVLGFSGNATNADATAGVLADLYPEADIVTFHYRGYPPSNGSPSAAAVREDAPRLYDLAQSRIHPARTVAVGFSIGSGVAAALARERPLNGLILVTPFDSLGRVAADHFPWLPVRLLFRHELDSASALAESTVPVALLAAGRDEVVGAARTQALRLAVRNLAFDRTVAEAGHNDIYQNPAFAPAMREALQALLGRPRR